MAPLPAHLLPSKNKESFSLVFRKGQTQWLVNLWSNQVTVYAVNKAPALPFAAGNLYRFTLPEGAKGLTFSFYKHALPSATQRANAEAKYASLIKTKLKEGFTLQADSRPTSARVKKQKETATKNQAPPKNAKGWEALRYWGTRHHEIDRSAFAQAIGVVKKRYGQRATLPPENITSFGELFESTTEAWVRFAAMLVAKHCVTRTAQPLEVDLRTGRATRSELLFIPGDLEIEGDLELGVDLLVAGSLTVNGLIRDKSEWTHLLVGGDLTATRGLDVGSQFYAAGEIAAPCIAIDGTGELSAKQISTKLLIEAGFDHSLTGKIKATHRLDFTDDTIEPHLAVLDRMLAPKTAKAIRAKWAQDGDGFYFPKDLLR
jgi:hypothetical protein